MYERSAIILEKYYNKVFEIDKKVSFKNIYKDYAGIIEKYKLILDIEEEEDRIIGEFDEIANQIRKNQNEQKQLHDANIKAEEDREQLFSNLDESPVTIDKKLKKLENEINKNNISLQEIRESFIKALTEFEDKQKIRSAYSKNRRAEEKNYIKIVDRAKKDMEQTNLGMVADLQNFKNSDPQEEIEEIKNVMIDNGKDEKVAFNEECMKKAVTYRSEIARKEAECYILVYDKLSRLLLEANVDDIKLGKYNKALRDISAKLNFLKAQTNYIVSFLDNERITAINGLKIHDKLMKDACEKFEVDMQQFNNLFELIQKEIDGKATKKMYKQLYNKEYLKNIQEKEKNFEKEIDGININAGTIINSNYWRIDEIKNIYDVFLNEIGEKFEKDLSEYKLEDIEEVRQAVEQKEEKEDDIFKSEIDDKDIEYVEEYEYEDEGEEFEENTQYEEDNEYPEEYEDDEYEDNEYDEEEYEDDEYEDDDYEDDEYENDEYEDDEYEDDEYEDDEYDDDEYDDDEYDDDDYEDDEYDNDDYEDDEYDDNEYEEDDDVVVEEHKDDYNEGVIQKKKKGKGLFGKFF